MAAPSYQAAGDGAAAQGNIAVPYPSGISAGHLLLLHLALRGANDPGDDPAPSGFTLIYGPDDYDGRNHYVFAKIATGSESGSLTVNRPASASDVFAGRMYRVIDWLGDATLANNFEGGAHNTGTDSSIEHPSVITSGVDRLVVAFVAVQDDNALDPFTGETGGDFTEAVAEFTSNLGSDIAIGLQIATLATAGTISGGSDTMAAADSWGVRAFAIKPVAAPTGRRPVGLRINQSVTRAAFY